VPRVRTGSAYQRSGRWIARITLHREPPAPSGRPAQHEIAVTRERGAITRAYARAFAARAQAQYDAGLWQPPRSTRPTERETVEAWVSRWLARQSYPSAAQDRARVALWLPRCRLASLPLASVTPRDVAGLLEQLRALPSPRSGAPLAPRTIRNVLDPIARALRAAVFEGLLASDPCAALPTELRPQARDADPAARASYRLSRAEVRALLTDPGCEDRWQTLWWILLATGVRVGEAIALRWSDLRPDEPLARLVVSGQYALGSSERTPTKTRTTREVPIHPELAARLAWWRSEGWPREYGRAPLEADLLVPAHAERGRGQQATAGQHLRHQHVHRALQRDLEGCGIRGHRVHDLRHTFVSLCTDAGVSAEVAERWTHAAGGSSARRLYLAPSWERQCAEVGRLSFR